MGSDGPCHKKIAVFGVSDQVMLEPACSATGTHLNVKSMYDASLDIILCRKQITKALMRL